MMLKLIHVCTYVSIHHAYSIKCHSSITGIKKLADANVSIIMIFTAISKLWPLFKGVATIQGWLLLKSVATIQGWLLLKVWLLLKGVATIQGWLLLKVWLLFKGGYY